MLFRSGKHEKVGNTGRQEKTNDITQLDYDLEREIREKIESLRKR